MGSPGFMRTDRTLFRVMSWLPASPSRYTSPSRFTIISCSSATRASGRWISQLALRPTRTQSTSIVLRVWATRPSGRCVRVTRRSFTRAASPVDEDRHDVHHECGEEHEGERHVEVEPHVEDRLVAQVPPGALEELVLLQQQAEHLLVELRGIAGEALGVLRPFADRRRGRAFRIRAAHDALQAPAQPRAVDGLVD